MQIQGPRPNLYEHFIYFFSCAAFRFCFCFLIAPTSAASRGGWDKGLPEGPQTGHKNYASGFSEAVKTKRNDKFCGWPFTRQSRACKMVWGIGRDPATIHR